jgi:hypothetical protein
MAGFIITFSIINRVKTAVVTNGGEGGGRRHSVQIRRGEGWGDVCVCGGGVGGYTMFRLIKRGEWGSKTFTLRAHS